MTTNQTTLNGFPWSNSLYTNMGTVHATTNNNIMQSVTVTNPGYKYGTITVPTSLSQYNSVITLSHTSGQSMLEISTSGEITWRGSLNKATKQFINSVALNLDRSSAKETALARSYRKALEKCLRQIKTMSKEEFIRSLETEIETRTNKEVYMILLEDEQTNGNN